MADPQKYERPDLLSLALRHQCPAANRNMTQPQRLQLTYIFKGQKCFVRSDPVPVC